MRNTQRETETLMPAASLIAAGFALWKPALYYAHPGMGMSTPTGATSYPATTNRDAYPVRRWYNRRMSITTNTNTTTAVRIRIDRTVRPTVDQWRRIRTMVADMMDMGDAIGTCILDVIPADYGVVGIVASYPPVPDGINGYEGSGGDVCDIYTQYINTDGMTSTTDTGMFAWRMVSA
jgi:hypothetical protein